MKDETEKVVLFSKDIQGGQKMIRKIIFAFLLVASFILFGCKISGTITKDGIGVKGVTVVLDGDAKHTVTTDSQGNYSFHFMAPGSYDITPTALGYTFYPEKMLISISQPYDSIDDVSFDVVEVSTITNSFGITFTPILAGTFKMGSPTDELGRVNDEKLHLVTLTKSFYMGTTEVTQAQWEAVVTKAEDMGILNPGDLYINPSYFNHCGTDCPVEYVSWNDVQIFIEALNMLGEGTYSLPTEAQWEYAARAGSTTALPNGELTEKSCGYDPNLDAIGWYCYNSNNEIQPVAQKIPNNWGLYDMHGNVREWCIDWYSSYPLVRVTDPTGPKSGIYRINRGGGWVYNAMYCRSANRIGYFPDLQHYFLGFRLLKIPE